MILNLLMSNKKLGPKLQFGGIIFLPLGLVLLIIFTWKTMSLPWGLSKVGQETISIEGNFGPSFGATYTIEVDGKRYVCSSGRSKLPRSYPIPILYDPKDPTRCRDKDVVDSIGEYELNYFLLGLVFLLIGLSIVLWLISHPRFQISEENDEKQPRRKVALSAEVVFYCVIALMILIALLPKGI
jgi:hypothetical protein